MRFVRADSDKPHRCPGCWRVAWGANGRRFRWRRTYSCERCQLRWWRGWTDDMRFTYFTHPWRRFTDYFGRQ